MKKLFLLCFLLPVLALAQSNSDLSGVYHWKEPVKEGNRLSSAVLFEGEAYDMQWMQMSANTLPSSGKKTVWQVPDGQEQLLIVKSGHLQVQRGDSVQQLGAGSVVVLLPGEKLSVQNGGDSPARYYLMKYRSKKAPVAEKPVNAGLLAIDWQQVPYKAHDKGGRRDFLERPTAQCRRLEIHVSTLNPGLKSHEPHTHKAEEIVLLTEGKTTMQIGDRFYNGEEGSVYFLGSNKLHAIQNVGSAPCTYFAIQFE